jgi:hypothetical protein
MEEISIGGSKYLLLIVDESDWVHEGILFACQV